MVWRCENLNVARHCLYPIDSTTEGCWLCGQSWHKGNRREIFEKWFCTGTSELEGKLLPTSRVVGIPSGKEPMFKRGHRWWPSELRYSQRILYDMCWGCTNQVGKLDRSGYMKPADATQAHILKIMNKGLTPNQNTPFPNALFSWNGEISAHVTTKAWETVNPKPKTLNPKPSTHSNGAPMRQEYELHRFCIMFMRGITL